MKLDTIQRILDHGMDYHFQNQNLATPEDIESFERDFERIHPDYIPYLLKVGFPSVGSEAFDRIEELMEVRNRLGRDPQKWGLPEGGKTKDTFVFHWDQSGNPVGISWIDRKVYVDDHDFGLGILLGNDIDEYVTTLLNPE